MAQTGIFQWIREGVRRSVLLGFSDAVEQIGTPGEANDLNPQLAALLRESPRAAELAASAPGQKPERKRLGRSLTDLSTAKKNGEAA